MDDYSQSGKRGIWAFLLVLFGVGLVAGLGLLRTDGLASRRLLLALALPTGLLWFLTIASLLGAIQAGRQGLALLVFAMLATYTAAGNSWVAGELARQVEGRYLEIDPLAEGEFDAVIVLGGVTTTAMNGRAQLVEAGDRVVLGARMFHLGRTKLLVTTGTVGGDGDVPDGSGNLVETREIWESLGVPSDKILQVPARSTEEELIAIQPLIAERQWKRVGLITSAWHMRRAQQIAASLELELVPLPADFRSHTTPFEWGMLIPSPTALLNTQLMVKELLASEVQR